jgi:hypothetical protein
MIDKVKYNIIEENTKVKGEIGEVIAASYLRKSGFIVHRPWRILGLLERVGVPNNYEVRFLKRYRKTMDFFAIFPGPDDYLIPRQVICDVFSKGGLDKYDGTQSKSQGFVVEVKSNLNGNSNFASKKQKLMFQTAKKLGFEFLLMQVNLQNDFTAEITVKNGKLGTSESI